MARRRVLAAVGAAAVCTAVALGGAVAGGLIQRDGASSAAGSPEPEAVLGPGTSVPLAPQPAGAPQPPAAGAWVGAWVRPDLPTPQARLAAVGDFESQLGRRLDVAHTYHPFDEPFPDAADRALVAGGRTLLLSWAGADTREVQAGRYDEQVREQARVLRDWGAPVLLEWRWEMDRPNLQGEVWSSADYIAAWRHLRRLFAEEGATSVAWVWCPTSAGFADGRAQGYYPGDDQVDWLCADVYPGRTQQTFAAAVTPFLAWARARPHPVLIGEVGMKRALGEENRQRWLADMGAFVQTQPQVKGLVYFDSDRSDGPGPAAPGAGAGGSSAGGGPTFDMSLRTAPGSMAVFRELASSPWFRSR